MRDGYAKTILSVIALASIALTVWIVLWRTGFKYPEDRDAVRRVWKFLVLVGFVTGAVGAWGAYLILQERIETLSTRVTTQAAQIADYERRLKLTGQPGQAPYRAMSSE